MASGPTSGASISPRPPQNWVMPSNRLERKGTAKASLSKVHGVHLLLPDKYKLFQNRLNSNFKTLLLNIVCFVTFYLAVTPFTA